MAYATFTDALTQAKRNTQLRGVPFSTRDMQNLFSGYMSGAGQRNITNRQLALQGDALSAQSTYWANQLANEREATGLTLAQQLAIAKQGWENDAEINAANLANASNIAKTTNQTNIDINNANLAAQAKIAADKLAADKAIAAGQADAAKKASENQLTGNIIGSAAGLGGAYLLSGSDTVGKSLSGIKGLFGGEPAPTTPPTESLLTQQGPYLTPDPSLTPTSAQPVQAAQTVSAPTAPVDTGGATLVAPGEIPSTGVPGDAGSLSGVTTDTIGNVNPMGDAPAQGGGDFSSIASPIGIILAAEKIRDIGGEQGKDYDEKSFSGKLMDSPVAMTSNPVAWLGAAFGTDLGGKESSRFERQIMAPIDFASKGLFGMLGGQGLQAFGGGLSGGHVGDAYIDPRSIADYEKAYEAIKTKAQAAGAKVPTPEEFNTIMMPSAYLRGAYTEDLDPERFANTYRDRLTFGFDPFRGYGEGADLGTRMKYDPTTGKWTTAWKEMGADPAEYFKGGF